MHAYIHARDAYMSAFVYLSTYVPLICLSICLYAVTRTHA